MTFRVVLTGNCVGTQLLTIATVAAYCRALHHDV